LHYAQVSYGHGGSSYGAFVQESLLMMEILAEVMMVVVVMVAFVQESLLMMEILAEVMMVAKKFANF